MGFILISSSSSLKISIMRRWFCLLFVIVKNVDFLTLFNVEKLLHKVAWAAGAIIFILVKWIFSETKQLFSVDIFRVGKSKNVSYY